MAGSANIVSELLRGVMNSNSTARLQRAMGSSGLGGANNPLAGLLDNLQGQLGGGTAGAPSSGLGGLANVARQLLGGVGSSPAAAGGAGALAGMLFGGGKGAMRGGALAVLGDLAASALAKSGRTAPPASPDELPGAMRAATIDPDADPELTDRADLILEAMVLAGKADGRLDAQELERIQGKMAEDDLEPDERRRLVELAYGDFGLEDLVAKINDAQTAAEVYAASALVIAVDTEAERRHLAELAERTQLDPETVNQIHDMLGIQ